MVEVDTGFEESAKQKKPLHDILAELVESRESRVDRNLIRDKVDNEISNLSSRTRGYQTLSRLS